MTRVLASLLSRPVLREILIAIALGSIGFGLNMLELQLGWGMHFVFGNALIYAFLRLLRPATMVAAVSIASLWTIVLWNHPWAWGVWTLEAFALAAFLKRTSPIRIDVIFWIIIGTPLLLATYGGAMGMDQMSLWLVIAKQATNGVLNVALGELLYATFISFLAFRGPIRVPRVSAEAFVMLLLTSIILIPTTVYLALDAPDREAGARNAVGRELEDGLQIAGERLAMWQESRGLMLEALAVESPALIPKELGKEFAGIAAYNRSGDKIWSVGQNRNQSAAAIGNLAMQYPLANGRAAIAELPAKPPADTGGLALLVPVSETGAVYRIVATLRENTLRQVIIEPKHHNLEGLLLVGPSQRPRTIHAISGEIGERMRPIKLDVQALPQDRATLVSMTSYGNALMSDLRDALMVRATDIPGLPGWKAIGAARLSGEVLKARQGQSQMFIALAAFVILITIAGSLLARRIESSLRGLARSAADLALMGTHADKIDSLVISELSDISLNIASVGTQVARERGALISYQRRLRSIAEHAPVVVYALEVVDGRKGTLLYLSETIGKMLGYTAEEIAEAGWWSHAVHPDDIEQCQAAFSNLGPGKTANLEYRVRHKNGDYIWVYDSLAVEFDPALDRCEAIGVLIDISERKHAADQLIHADRMTSLGRMVAGVAHELNQPLNFIKMAATNLRERSVRGQFDPERFSAKLDSMIAHVNRSAAIILQMRVFGRKPTEAPHPIAVHDAIEDVLTMVRTQFDADGIAVDYVSSDTGLKVRALPVLLEQVLLNLMLNAGDAIRSRMNSGDGTPGRIWIRASKKKTQVVVTVEDNGTGIAEATLPILFEPFFTTKPPKEGTGLGLSISYGIIHDLGGSIRAENTGTGARIIIELPLAHDVAEKISEKEEMVDAEGFEPTTR